MSITAYNFSSPTCAPCKVIKPALDDLKEEFPDIQWISVNVQNDPHNYAQKLGVNSWPTTVVIARDAVGNTLSTEKHSGTAMMGYYRIIRNAIKTANA